MSLFPQQPAQTTQSSATQPTNQNQNEIAKTVPVFQHEAYLHFQAWPEEISAECVHAAQFHHPEAGRLVAYAKMYLNKDGLSRGLLNEITAFILGRILGAPLAEYAFVCFIPLSKLPAPVPPWVKSLLKANKASVYPAFCTSKINGGNAKIHLENAGDKLFAEDLKKWPDLPLAARFDQHVSNTDRHMGNLIRTGKHEYRLFDHGRLVTTDGHWTAQDLSDKLSHMHKDRLIKRAWPDQCPRDLISELVMHLGFHDTAMSIALPELRWWWDQLAQPEDAANFEQYLITRAKELSGMYQREYNVIA